MDEDKILKILDKVHSNNQFSKLLEEGESKDIIKNLQKDGVEVDEKDIADSLKVKLIIENLGVTREKTINRDIEILIKLNWIEYVKGIGETIFKITYKIKEELF